ncbi:hypothetical protein EVAR_33114_1 [Eumeta japonica]|uniref:Uncharacterized protein n=1 Tax=Eumeta variegata TaxID=151549 RepID=A0A4C1Y651_EUMVA|nr:hypothetical protein EVAR_33114_1 [Eumeta japonica]
MHRDCGFQWAADHLLFHGSHSRESFSADATPRAVPGASCLDLSALVFGICPLRPGLTLLSILEEAAFTMSRGNLCTQTGFCARTFVVRLFRRRTSSKEDRVGTDGYLISERIKVKSYLES